MNLHAIVYPVISAINPMIPITIKVSNGYTVDAEGRQVPAYTPVSAIGQVQSLTFRDIQMIAGLTLNGTRRAIYITGNFDSTERVTAKGGDLIVFANIPAIPEFIRGTTWLVAMQLEAWDEPSWCKVAVTLQLDPVQVPKATISVTQTGIQTALRGFIIGILPDVEVILGQVNRVPEPRSPDFIVYWPRSQERLATNILSYIDTIVVGSISGTILTVDTITQGVVLPGAVLTNGSGLITLNTTVTSQLSGSTGGTGTYRVSPSQTFGSGVIRSGVRYDTVPTQAMLQLDIHGPNSWNNTKIIETLFRSIYGVDSFAATGIEVAPLYCNEAKQIPFENAEQQYEDQWVLEACLQFNPAVGTPQQFADMLEITLIDAVTAYPVV